MAWQPGSEENQSALIGNTAIPLPGPPDQNKSWWRAFFRTASSCLQAIRGYTAEHIGRAKEAGVQKLEGEAQKSIAEAEAKLAEAAERHANAEKIRAEADKIRAEADKTRAEADKTRAESDKLRAEAYEIRAKAELNFYESISIIKQKGGSVQFDKEKLIDLSIQGQKLFPDDPVLKEAEEENVDEMS